MQSSYLSVEREGNVALVPNDKELAVKIWRAIDTRVEASHTVFKYDVPSRSGIALS